jgi:hypothetical protein
MANTNDFITFDIAREIINAGYDAIPVPASEAASIAEKLDTKAAKELDWDLTSSTLRARRWRGLQVWDGSGRASLL